MIFFLGMLGGCESDKILVVHDEPPAVAIQDPNSGATFYAGEEINFVALVETYDGTDFVDIVHQWESDEATICVPTPVEETGYAICTASLDQVRDYTITINISHPSHPTASDSIEITIDENTPPEIEILSPQDGDILPEDELILFSAIVNDVDESEENLQVAVTSSLDGDLEITANATSSGEFTGGKVLSVGEHLITMTVTDSAGRTDQASIILTVYAHAPPTISAATIDPSLPVTTDDLSAVAQNWFDYEGSVERNKYRWFHVDEDGNLIEDMTETTSLYPAAKTVKRDLIQVEITPYNDYGDGTPFLSSVVEVINTAPSTPTVVIEPSAPQPSDSLYCIAQDSIDADEDSITYEYAWYKSGVDLGVTVNVLDAQFIEHGDSIECRVNPFDGEDYGLSSSAYAVVTDTVAPSPPQFDSPPAYGNETELDLTGLCEPECALTFYCEDPISSWTDTGTCDLAGTFVYPVSLTPGQTTLCYSTCEDMAGNLSGSSNTIQMEACDPEDVYEMYGGNDVTTAIDQWSALADDGSTSISILGNILSDDSSDWFVISASDDLSQDLNDGRDNFRFAVEFVSGSSDYAFTVYRGGTSSVDLECDTAGYTQYDDFNQDIGDSDHEIPTDAQSCGNGSGTLNDCADDSKEYYIHVFRKTTVSSCQSYELNITNGVW